MKAVVYEGPDKVALQSVPGAELQAAHGAVLEVEHASICGSDLHFYWGEFGDPAGMRPGHEFIGRVVEAGSELQRFKKGDRVMTAAVFGCGNCASCRGFEVQGCEHGWQIPGVGHELAGGQAEAVWVPNADFNLAAVPESMPAETAVLLTDVFPTGYSGALRADIQPGDTVAVFGLGPIGMAALTCARILGAARIIAVDRLSQRLQRAAELGAITIDASQHNSVERIMELTHGRGADAVIEAVGVDDTINAALAAAAVASTVSVLGVSANFALPIAPAVLGSRNITLRVSTAAIQGSWPALLKLLESGQLDDTGYFSHRFALEQAGDAYATFAERRDGCFKIMFDL